LNSQDMEAWLSDLISREFRSGPIQLNYPSVEFNDFRIRQSITCSAKSRVCRHSNSQ
jgi:hypothetical protein